MSSVVALLALVHPASAAGRAPIAHAGADQTVEGGSAVTLDATSSWDADGESLTFTWIQTEGPAVSLDVADPAHPTFTAPTPGSGGVAAENQVVVFRLTVSDGANTSAPSEVRFTVLKPFIAANDNFAVVTNTLCRNAKGVLEPGSFGAALHWAVRHPGTRVTFNIPATDPGYNVAGGFWHFPTCGLPLLRYAPLNTIAGVPDPLLANGITIDGWSQRTNAAAAGTFVNPHGPALFSPGAILEVGWWQDAAPPARIVIRGLAQEMYIEKANDLVLSGNHHNVMPDGLSQARPAGQHVSFSSGGTTCGRLMIRGGTHIRVGGATPEERNLIGGGCPPFVAGPRTVPIRDLQVVGNYFGVDRTGGNGILDPASPSSPVTIDAAFWKLGTDVRIGGVEPGTANVIAGFGSQDGLLVQMGREDHRVLILGNRIGTDATGASAIPNRHGLNLMQLNEVGAGPEWIVGGPEPGAGNVISGNASAGLMVDNQSGSDFGWRLKIQGNLIGTSADGLSAIPNDIGLWAEIAGGDTLIGGSGPGEGNVVSGNRNDGVYVNGYPEGVTPARALGNLIGVGADGITPLGNGRNGIQSYYYAQALKVGGVDPGEGNVIAYNGRNGLVIDTGCCEIPRRGTVRGNSIHSNGGIGIALSNGTTPTPNNAGDVPAGLAPNDRRNYPVLTSAQSSPAGGTTIAGTLDTIAGLSVTIDFYANTTPDPSGFGEGERWIGSHSFVAGAGPTPFTAVLPDIVLPAGTFVTSTTTDAAGNTSEFSRFVTSVTLNAAPHAEPDDYSTDEGTPLDVAAPGVLTNDSDSDGDRLTASLVTGAGHGTVTVDADGAVHYTPAAGFHGTDSFTYGVFDGIAYSDSATVTITVNRVAPPPVIAPRPDIVAEATGPAGAEVTYAAPTTESALDGPGIATCDPASASTFPLGATTVTCQATDSLGRPAVDTSFLVTVVDTTPPVVTGEVTPAPNAAGWHNSPATVEWTMTDAVGVATSTGCDAVIVSTDTLGTTFTCEAADAAGNTGRASVTVKLDQVAPAVTFHAVSPAANAHGWHRQHVSMPFTVSDAGSGLGAGVPADGTLTFTTDGAGMTQTVTATDIAGNTRTSASPPVSIDRVAPTIVAARTPDANAYGWNNTDVTVSFTCADALSDIASCSPAAAVAAEGQHQSRTGTAIDRAGNEASATMTDIHIDRTPPVVSISSPGDGAELDTEQTLAVGYRADDGLSGLALLHGSLDGTPVASGDTIDLGPWTGIRTLRVEGLDLAGNAAAAAVTFTVRRAIAIDIKPGSCPNPLGTRDRGVLPVAIAGLPGFDVRDIDLASIRLEGVAPARAALEDAATPYGPPYLAKQEALDCTTRKGDGTIDLSLKFDVQAIIEALGPVSDFEVRRLRLIGRLTAERGGTPFVGVDVVRIQSR